MQKFWWPGFEMQLVVGLQRQQKSSQFCDTLLQTESISVPTHSCVLAALSPYLCQRLSASPSPPFGQKRQLQLQAVTSQTLLKLVGLLYSGQLEVRGSKEQNDVLAAAHQLGIGDLVLGDKDGWVKGGDLLNRSVGKQAENEIHAEETRLRRRGLRTQDEQIQAEMNGTSQNDPHVKKKCFVSVATQTIKAAVSSGFSSDQTPEGPQPQSIPPSDQLHFCPAARSEFPAGRPSASETNTTSVSTLSASFSDDQSSPRSQEENLPQQPSEAGVVALVLNDDGTRRENRDADGPTAEDGGSSGQPREEKTAGQERNSAGKRHTGGKSLENMKEVETSQISVKMKLRRNTEKKAWRVVSSQDEDETSEKQGGSDPSAPQVDQTSSVLQETETPNLPPVLATSPQPPEHDDKDSEPQCDMNPDHSGVLEPQPQGSVDDPDPDPDINRILDEIMMGLNFLPSLDDETAQTSHDGGQNFFQVLENRGGSTHAGCDFYKSFRLQSVPSSADADKCCDSAAEDPSVFPQTIGSILPSACVLREPILHCPGSQPLSSQDDRSVLPVLLFLPPSREDEPQPEPMFSLSCLDELRLPRPISPLEPGIPEAQQPHPNRSFILPENPLQQSSHRPLWFTETPRSLQFPIRYLTEENSESEPQGSEQRCVGWRPDTCAETAGAANEGGNKPQPGEKSDPEKMKKRKRVAAGEAVAVKKRRRDRNVPQDSQRQCLDCKKPASCSASSSFNHLLVVEPRTDTNSSNWTRTSSEETTRTSVEENTGMVGNGAQQTLIRTRSFMKRFQEKKSDKIPKKSGFTHVFCKTEAKEKQGTLGPKRRPGRPRKIKLGPLSPEERNSSEAGEQPEPTDGGRKRRRKARRSQSGEEETKSDERAGGAAAAAVRDPETRKQSLMTTLKEFQKFLKRQKKEPTGSRRNERDAGNGSKSEAAVEIKESIEIQDKNQRFLLTSAAAQWNKLNQDDASSSTAQKMSFNEDNLPSDDFVDLMEPLCAPHQLLKNEGASCWTGGSEAGPSVISLGAKLPQTTRKVLSQRTGRPLSGANGLAATPRRDREQDEEEVDVLLLSPGNALPVAAPGESTKTLERISCDEDEDDDVNEIDVTGDEEE